MTRNFLSFCLNFFPVLVRLTFLSVFFAMRSALRAQRSSRAVNSAVRVPSSHGGSREFKSLTAHQKNKRGSSPYCEKSPFYFLKKRCYSPVARPHSGPRFASSPARPSMMMVRQASPDSRLIRSPLGGIGPGLVHPQPSDPSDTSLRRGY